MMTDCCREARVLLNEAIVEQSEYVKSSSTFVVYKSVYFTFMPCVSVFADVQGVH